ncbi:unnamed protein product [Ectocarpus sp. CCAP 1310/34]|nr:unnamed protein product [Ectocarpus sp. CCAP 1310/34]
MTTVGPISASSEKIEALLVEQRASDAMELPKVLIRTYCQNRVAIKKPASQSTPRFGTRPMSAEFEEQERPRWQ